MVLFRHQADCGKVLHDGAEEVRRGGEVIEIVAVGGVVFVDFLEQLLQLLIGAVIPELAGHVVDVALEPLLQVGIDRFAGKFLQVLRQLGAKFVGGHLVPRDTDHGKLSRQKIVFRQVVKRRDQLAAGKIAGRAENNHCARIATTPDPLGFC